jgi:hypothetical protein
MSAWNSLLFNTMDNQVIAMVFLDPLDPRDILADSEAARFGFITWAPWAMIANSFGLLSPFFQVISYFRPVWRLPPAQVSFYIDSVSRQSFWSTLVDETQAASLSATETLAKYPYGTFALQNLPILLWTRPESSSMDYYSTLSSNCLIRNLTSQGHWFLFEKPWAVDIVDTTLALVMGALGEKIQE